jgi:tetratricopeptide (TPR) repeat protein
MAVVLSAASTAPAGTWRLDKDGDLKAVSAGGQDKFLIEVAQAKELVNAGRARAARDAYDAI